MQLASCNLSLFFSIATCFGLLDHHKVIYTIITKIKLCNGSVVLDLLVLLPALQYSSLSSLIT
jgi:hypothetical protein